MRSALLLVNFHSRQGKQKFPLIQSYLKNLGFNLITKDSHHPQEIPQLIIDHQQDVDLVIIGGGDGTLNAAISGIVQT